MKEMLPTSKYLTTMKVISYKSLFLLLAYLTCCIWAWPAASPSVYRRNSNANINYFPISNANGPNYEADYPQLPISDGYNTYNSQWDKAKEPLNYYDLLDDYLMNQASSGTTDVETYPNLVDLYDPPVWGKIIKEKPESELEELKAEERELEAEAEDRRLAENTAQHQYYAYDYAGHPQKRGETGSKTDAERHPAAAMASSSPTATPTGVVTSTPTANQKPEMSTLTPKKVAKLLHQQPGMKEFPMLRPPIKGKQMVEQQNEENQDLDGDVTEQEPVIALAQRSVAEKLSAYDKLRKYLSLEDALKKEAEKRRSTPSRVQKRAPAGNKFIVTDVDTLSGQLKNLKKSAI